MRGVRLTAITAPSDEERLMRGLLLPGVAPSVAGCSRSSPTALATESDESAGATGARSKGEASPSPAAAAAPFAAPEQAQESKPVDMPSSPAVAAPTASPQYAAKAGGKGGAPALEADALGDDSAQNARREPAPGLPMARPARPAMAAKVGPSTAPPPPRDPAGDVKDRGGPAAGRDESKGDKAKKTEKNDPNAVPKVTASSFAAAYRIALVRSLARCSDVAARPLSERLVIWQKRAKKATSANELATLYDHAYGACELPDWRDEAALLDIVQQRIDTEQAADVILGHLAAFPEGQRFVARNLLRRTVDVRIAAAVSRAIYGGVDWPRLDREIGDMDKADKQLARLKMAMLVAPGDPQGDVRLVKLLARNGQRTEAVAHGRRLRDRGFLTPTLAQQLGDVLAETGDQEEALRTYSEIVEFDGQSALSRRVLGDIFLRQAWYPAAYRQYKTLTDLDGKNPLAWLRLANAAAGAGRVDEALRIEREVAGGEGTPGPNDPRMFARLLSASRLGALLDKPDPAAGVTAEAVSRKIKELSLFSGPGTLSILTWDDLDAQLVVGTLDEKKEQLVGEATDAGAVGLYAVLSAPESWERVPHAARYKSEILQRKVPFRLVTLVWTGKEFKVTTKKGELKPGVKQEAL
jgi:tetratricopeptide (TPR) repeat protein